MLASFGIEEEDRRELRADFQHLRRWRKSVEQAQGYTFKAVISVIVAGFLGAVWLGIKVDARQMIRCIAACRTAGVIAGDAVPCWVVRRAVAQYGEAAAEAWARAKGFSTERSNGRGDASNRK